MDRYEYDVSGRLNFPIDMLRRDRAWPATEKDSAVITGTLYLERPIEPVAVMVHGINAPTVGRWASMGWRVGTIVRVRNVGTVKERRDVMPRQAALGM